MKRTALLELLNAYNPQALEEQGYKQQIIDFVVAQPECFERSLAIGHITASAWLLNKARTHALLMHHRKLDLWMQLGGHCDGDSDVLGVAIKEIQEESGIIGVRPLSAAIFDIDVHLIPANSKEAAHYHYDIRFLLGVESDEQFIQNPESKELRWISKNPQEMPTQERSVVRMYEKWISNLVSDNSLDM